MRGNILVIDDEKYVYEDLEFGLGKAHNIFYAFTLSRINSILKSRPIDLAMVDLNMNLEDRKSLSGLNYIKTLRLKYPNMAIVVLSGFSDESKIVQATKNGADHYLIKGNLDTDSDEFREQVRKWINAKKRLDEKRELQSLSSWGITEYSEEVIKLCNQYCLKKQSYFLIGEAGLGKRHLLEKVYRSSKIFKEGKNPQLVDLNNYLDFELRDFLQLKKGKGTDNFFRNAPTHILYIRNIESQSVEIQYRFLEVLDSNRFVDQKEVFDLQLIFLLEEDPESLLSSGKLSPELTSFLKKVRIAPLKEQRAKLKEHIRLWCSRNKYPKSLPFSKEAMTLLRRYPFPGNFSELHSVLEDSLKNHKKQFALDWQNQEIRPESIPNILHQTSSDLHEEMQYEVARVHLRFIEQALMTWEGDRRQKDKAAIDLNVHSADNLKKTFINKYWMIYPDLVKGFPSIMKKYKLHGK